MSATIECRLCGGVAALRFEKRILGRHAAGYYQCEECGLTQTNDPTWLDEAYRDAIHPTDTGIVARNLGARNTVAAFLQLAGVTREPCLDWAAGYGIFVRLMRDAGFAFHWSDPYAENLLARGLEWSDALGTPRCVTAFEVLEHLVRPREEFAKLAALGPEWIVTSTELHTGATPSPDWPYLSTESGQHVSFYRADTLARLGRDAGYPFVLTDPFFQIFARRPFPAWRWRLARRLAGPLFPVVRRLRRPLTVEDCERARMALRAGFAGRREPPQ